MKTENVNFTKKSNGTFVFPQISKAAAKAKFARLQSGAGWYGGKHFTIGFANWTLNEENAEIECYTNYHAESTVLDMYVSNCKKW